MPDTKSMDALREAVARAVFEKIDDLDIDTVVGSFMPGGERQQLSDMVAQAAIAIARPIIERDAFERAAKVAEECQEIDRYVVNEVAKRITQRIRALA